MHPAFLLQLTALSELVRNPDPSIEFACYFSNRRRITRLLLWLVRNC